MASIEFTGFVEDWTKNNSQHPDWAMKTSEPHRKKDGDKWVTIGRTFRTVKAGYEVKIDFTAFAKGDRVTVIGKEVTEVREHDGKKYYDLVVKADTITLDQRSDTPRAAAPAPAVDDWSATGADTPF